MCLITIFLDCVINHSVECNECKIPKGISRGEKEKKIKDKTYVELFFFIQKICHTFFF